MSEKIKSPVSSWRLRFQYNTLKPDTCQNHPGDKEELCFPPHGICPSCAHQISRRNQASALAISSRVNLERGTLEGGFTLESARELLPFLASAFIGCLDRFDHAMTSLQHALNQLGKLAPTFRSVPPGKPTPPSF